MKKFSLDDFKSWLTDNEEVHEEPAPVADVQSKFVNKFAESKVSLKKLVEKIETDGDVEELAAAFEEHGGVIIDTEGKNLIIQLDEGTISIPRFCVEIDD